MIVILYNEIKSYGRYFNKRNFIISFIICLLMFVLYPLIEITNFGYSQNYDLKEPSIIIDGIKNISINILYVILVILVIEPINSIPAFFSFVVKEKRNLGLLILGLVLWEFSVLLRQVPLIKENLFSEFKSISFWTRSHINTITTFFLISFFLSKSINHQQFRLKINLINCIYFAISVIIMEEVYVLLGNYQLANFRAFSNFIHTEYISFLVKWIITILIISIRALFIFSFIPLFTIFEKSNTPKRKL